MTVLPIIWTDYFMNVEDTVDTWVGIFDHPLVASRWSVFCDAVLHELLHLHWLLSHWHWLLPHWHRVSIRLLHKWDTIDLSSTNTRFQVRTILFLSWVGRSGGSTCMVVPICLFLRTIARCCTEAATTADKYDCEYYPEDGTNNTSSLTLWLSAASSIDCTPIWTL